MHTPPSALTSLASLATSLASYVGKHVPTLGMIVVSASHMSRIIDSFIYLLFCNLIDIDMNTHPRN